jgi:hypothetical protein
MEENHCEGYNRQRVVKPVKEDEDAWPERWKQ